MWEPCTYPHQLYGGPLSTHLRVQGRRHHRGQNGVALAFHIYLQELPENSPEFLRKRLHPIIIHNSVIVEPLCVGNGQRRKAPVQDADDSIDTKPYI